MAPVCTAAPDSRTAHRTRPLHRRAHGTQHRHVGAFHPDSPAPLLPCPLRVSPRIISCGVRQFSADAQPAAQSAAERPGRRRCDRGGAACRPGIPAMRSAKRTLDLVGASVGVLLLSPLFLLLALLVKSEDGGPVFFRQERVGYRGRPFHLWKFRTMVADAAARGLPLTVGCDARVTRIGAWLRRLKLDELPQLFNVLVGEMSLVGPRPEVPC